MIKDLLVLQKKNFRIIFLTLIHFLMPWNWFKLQPHKTDSTASKTLSLVRGGNAQLGNCYKNRLAGDTYVVRVKLFLARPAVRMHRLKLMITRYNSKAKIMLYGLIVRS